MNSKILIVCGDPNSINSEIIFKSWRRLSSDKRKKILLIGNHQLIKDQAKKLGLNIPIKKINNIDENIDKNYLNIIDLPLKYKNCFNVPIVRSSNYVKACLNLADNLCKKNKVKGFINCPIDKKLIKQKGIYGVTEFIAKKSKKSKFTEVMMLYNKSLSVVPITTHIKIKDVSTKISKNILIKKINTIIIYYKKLFNFKPKIAVLGLNPHNSEFEKSSEEVKQIIPAIKYLNKSTKIDGPMSADSFFISKYKKYNVIVGMYHDQVLIPFKNLFKFNAINITLGLEYIRISPDHGTAKNLIGKNKALPESLITSINFLNKLK